MKRIQLIEIAHARSGDKGDTANVGLIALNPKNFGVLKKYVTAEKVKEHLSEICLGPVDRYELPNLGALNFMLHQSLGGGGTLALQNDAQGKTYGSALLRMWIEVEDGEKIFDREER